MRPAPPRARPARTRLGPTAIDRFRTLLRTRGWPRTMALRRITAGALVLLAGALALRPAGAADNSHAPVVVAAHDLTPGHTLAAADLVVRELPADLAPHNALNSTSAAIGQVLAGAVRAGEPLTDVRLVGPADIALTTGDPNATAVPVRLADPDVADLLHPGARVDVVSIDPDRQADPVLAENATVLTVREQTSTSGQRDSLVVVGLPRLDATRVAAASLRQPVTVTLR